jgi:uncharacterized protein YbbK (DUF523 family)
MNILVSACLLGVECRYSGDGCFHTRVDDLKKEHNLIPICPEQLGGLPTPRNPVEIVDGKALDKEKNDFTKQFQKGAEETLKIAKLFDCKKAILKCNSPSCGYGIIYDGTFSGKKIKGNGFAADLLSKNGIVILSENDMNGEV